MIKIAYLIEAHTDIYRLISLCEALKLSGDIFIHIDKKNKNNSFWNLLIDYESQNRQVYVLKNNERINVAWGGFSQVICFENLLKKAISSNTQYERFILLSGLDYPVWSPQKIKNFYEENKDKEYVCGFNISKSKFKSQTRKIKYYHFFRDIPLKHNSVLRRLIIGGSMIALKILGFKRKPHINVNNKIWDIYFGSQWISITRKCAEYILLQLKNKRIRRYFSSVYAPDELCVPTIVMNSEFRNNAIEVKELTFQNITPLHYLNYEECIRIYDENDYDTILQSNKMFVRKVISGKSETLVEMIRRTWKS